MRSVAETEIELTALEFTELRALMNAEQGEAPGVEANMLKIRGTEVQQKISEMLMKAMGYYALPCVPEAMEYGWNEAPIGPEYASGLAPAYFNMRKTTIYGRDQTRSSATSSPGWCWGHEPDSASLSEGTCTRTTRSHPVNFSLNEEQRLLEDSAERFVRENCSLDRRRTLVASEPGYSERSWRQMADLGWLGVGVHEAFGGTGGGPGGDDGADGSVWQGPRAGAVPFERGARRRPW